MTKKRLERFQEIKSTKNGKMTMLGFLAKTICEQR